MVKKKNIVLPKYNQLSEKPLLENVAVFIHLHYLNDIEFYISYIEKIPVWIDIFISYTDENIKMIVSQKIKRNNLFFVLKNNRGRDVSALLVAFRKYIIGYEYVCFLHDKKEKIVLQKEDTRNWVNCLWDNMLGSEIYIENIIYTLKINEKIGLLVPPNDISMKECRLHKRMWGENLYNTQVLAKELGLVCNPNYEDSTIALGTVFWARTSALKKLFWREWKYEDFLPEPLPNDGTLSHAIERILPYVVFDSGFDTNWIMNHEYASIYIEKLIDVFSHSMKMLDKYLGIDSIYEMEKYEFERERLLCFSKEKKKIYIYGAGVYGVSCLKLMNSIGIIPESFIVSSIEKDLSRSKSVCGIPVLEIAKLTFSNDDGIVIALNSSLKKEVMDILCQKGVNLNNVISFSKIELE